MLRVAVTSILLLIASSSRGVAQGPAPAAARASADSVRAAWVPKQVLNRTSVASLGVDSPSIIVFRNGRRFQTGLFQVEFQGLLLASPVPYVVLTGRGCTECDANISLYILSPVGGPAEATTRRLWAPGHETDRESRKVIRSSQAFVGQCLPGLGDVLLTYDSIIDTARQWHSGLFIAQIVADTVARELRIPPPPIATTVATVKAGRCRQIAGIDQESEP
jgi:hypothetical protein